MARKHRFKSTKPVDPTVLMVTVKDSRRVSPNIRRVTLAGEGLTDFTYQGFDQWFRLFLPRAGQEVLKLPSSTNAALWLPKYLMTSRDRRPWVRNYTVRSWRDSPNGRELDIDFVIHGTGPASDFAVNALPGTSVGLLDQGLGYEPHRPERSRLLVADESGLPAILGIIDSEEPQVRLDVFVEVATLEDVQDPVRTDNLSLHWVVRNDPELRPGQTVLNAVKEAPVAMDSVYAYAVGEQSLATGVRRHLVNDRNVPKGNVTFVGYWRHGRAAPS